MKIETYTDPELAKEVFGYRSWADECEANVEITTHELVILRHRFLISITRDGAKELTNEKQATRCELNPPR